MLTRRQLRIKVMQAIFAFQRQQPDDLKELEKFLNGSMAQTFTLFLYMVQLLVELHKMADGKVAIASKKLLGSEAQKNLTRIFVENKALVKLANSAELQEALSKRKIAPWHLDLKYIEKIYEAMIVSKEYVMYTSAAETTFKQDVQFLTFLYTDIIAPSEEILDFLEDITITWTDDYPLVNTSVLLFLKKLKPTKEVVLPVLIKDQEDVQFAMDLFRKSILFQDELLGRIDGKTPNWEKDRIAQLDLVLIIMAQVEFLYFPSIPVKVTLNEYLEVAKDYSSPKSSVFINGIVDNLLKEFQAEGKLNKIGRGLME